MTLLAPKQAAEYLAVSPATLAKWRCAGIGPSYAKVGSRIRYSQQWLEKWIETQKVEAQSRTYCTRDLVPLPRAKPSARLGRHKTRYNRSD